jgi:16S rRNA (guanine527-N7)-methyltransferase
VFRDLLSRRASSFCQLSSVQLEQLERHFEMMMRWNKTINLTRIQEMEEVVDRHYGESLFLGSNLPPGPLRIADIGSGAGFPGVPVAVLRPDCSVTLIESHRRKAVFLKEATRGFSNIGVVAKRAEDVNQRFDWGVSRAVSWESLELVVFRLTPNLALLGNPPTDEGIRTLPIPWDSQRSLIIVSRGTPT